MSLYNILCLSASLNGLAARVLSEILRPISLVHIEANSTNVSQYDEMTFFGKSAFCSTPKNVVSHPCGIWLLLQQCKLTHFTTILRRSIGLEPARNNYYTFPVYTASALEQLCVVSQHFFRTLAVVILTVAMYTSWDWIHRHIRQPFLLVALIKGLFHSSHSSLWQLPQESLVLLWPRRWNLGHQL